MEEHHEDERAGLVGSAPSPDSLLEALAEARADTAEDRETFIAIPGYEKAGLELLARYRLLSGPEIEAIGRRALGKQGRRRTFQQGLVAACDTMAAACTGIFFQRPEDNEPQQLTVGGEPIINYGDPKLKQALKIGDDVNTTRGVILSVFCDNELAVVNHSTRLQMWFGDTNSQVDADFLGEGA
jgi:hypothetical protein